MYLELCPAGGSGTPPAETRLESNILDISGLSGTKANWSGAAFIDAEQKLGDAKAQLTGVCMHFATEAYLKKQNLIETVQPSNDVASVCIRENAYSSMMAVRY